MTPEERCLLISKYLDQSLDEREELLLARMLRTDPEMVRWFCELALQHTRLGRMLRKKAGSSSRLRRVPAPKGSSICSRLLLWVSMVFGEIAAALRWSGRRVAQAVRPAGLRPSPRPAVRRTLSGPSAKFPGRTLHAEENKTAPTRQ